MPTEKIAISSVHCDICGKPATTADGIVGAYLCDDDTCLVAAYDRAHHTEARQ